MGAMVSLMRRGKRRKMDLTHCLLISYDSPQSQIIELPGIVE